MWQIGVLTVLMAIVVFIAGLTTGGDRLGQRAAREAVQEYIAEATSLRNERGRALYVVERVDKALAGIDPDATATYDALAQVSDEALIRDLSARFKQALMESALAGGIVPEDHPFEVADILGEMRSTAMRRLKD